MDCERLIAHETDYACMCASLVALPAYRLLTNLELPVWYDANRALRLRCCGRAPEAVADDVVHALRSLGLRVVIDLDPVAEAQGLGAAVRRLGIMPVVGDRLLMTTARPPEPVHREGIDVECSGAGATAVAVGTWIHIRVAADDAVADSETRGRVAVSESEHPGCSLYLGRVGGTPAGVCSLFVKNGLARVDSVATLAPYRRQGIAMAVVSEALREAFHAGVDQVYLFTDKDGAGERVYTRLGFTIEGLNVLRRHVGAEPTKTR